MSGSGTEKVAGGKRRLAWWIKGPALLLGLVAVVLAAHPLWVGPAGSALTGSVAPGFTGTEVELGGLSANLYSGKISAEGFRLGNPEGAPEGLGDALSVKKLEVEADALSALTDAVKVRKVRIEGPHAAACLAGGKLNFAAIGEHVEKKLGKKKKKKDSKDVRVDVESFEATDVRVALGTVSELTVPRISLETVANVATLTVENFRIANPKDGGSVPDAVRAKKVTVKFDWASIWTKRIRVYDVTLEEPYVSAYFASPANVKSFNLLKVFSGVIPPEDAEKAKGGEKKGKKDDGGDDVKIEIDRIALVRTNCRLMGTECGAFFKEVVEIRDIGKGGGTDADDIIEDEIWPRLKKELGPAFERTWDAFAKMYGFLSKGFGKGVSSVLETSAGKAAGAAVRQAAEGAAGLAGGVGNLAAEGAKEAGAGAEKALDSVKDGAEALKNAASGGLESLKKLNPFAK